jgi:hypothetical protein
MGTSFKQAGEFAIRQLTQAWTLEGRSASEKDQKHYSQRTKLIEITF